MGGGSRGLGRAIAYALAQEGTSVTLFARTEGPLVEAARAINAATGRPAHPVVADATSAVDLARVADETLRRFGRIDIVVNNAGGPPLGKFEDFDDAARQRAFELSLMSAVRLTRLAASDMRRRRCGRVLNLLSWTVRQPGRNLILSNSVRMAVLGLTKTLAQELAPDILVNNVAPGHFLTDRARHINELAAKESGRSIAEVDAAQTAEIALGCYGQPEEFAVMVAFLASERASYITGQTFLCDGGLVGSV